MSKIRQIEKVVHSIRMCSITIQTKPPLSTVVGPPKLNSQLVGPWVPVPPNRVKLTQGTGTSAPFSLQATNKTCLIQRICTAQPVRKGCSNGVKLTRGYAIGSLRHLWSNTPNWWRGVHSDYFPLKGARSGVQCWLYILPISILSIPFVQTYLSFQRPLPFCTLSMYTSA